MLSAILLLAACGGSDATPKAVAAAPTTANVVATTEPAPATTDAVQPAPTTTTARATATTAKATTTTFAPIETSLPATTTTTSTTSTTILVVDAPVTAPVQQPIAPPVDALAKEPVIEVGSIVIPKLGVDMTMYEGIRLSTLDYGPGHWPGTAMPGQAGNVVVGGHRTSSHRVFRDVDQLVPGDEIRFRDAAGEHTYAVNRVEIVEPTAMWIVDPTETATATLFACHPPGSTAQRIVVFADLVEG